jgi:hypothetical protein
MAALQAIINDSGVQPFTTSCVHKDETKNGHSLRIQETEEAAMGLIRFIIGLIGGLIGLVVGIIGAVIGLVFGLGGAVLGLVIGGIVLLVLAPIILLLILIF